MNEKFKNLLEEAKEIAKEITEENERLSQVTITPPLETENKWAKTAGLCQAKWFLEPVLGEKCSDDEVKEIAGILNNIFRKRLLSLQQKAIDIHKKMVDSVGI